MLGLTSIPALFLVPAAPLLLVGIASLEPLTTTPLLSRATSAAAISLPKPAVVASIGAASSFLE